MAERSRALGSQPRGPGFDAYSGRSCSATLGKLGLSLTSSLGWDVGPSSGPCSMRSVRHGLWTSRLLLRERVCEGRLHKDIQRTGRKSPQNQRRNRMYWANSRRITAVQLIYAGFGEREEEEEEGENLKYSNVEEQKVFTLLTPYQRRLETGDCSFFSD